MDHWGACKESKMVAAEAGCDEAETPYECDRSALWGFILQATESHRTICILERSL